jgi:hypothetical protein
VIRRTFGDMLLVRGHVFKRVRCDGSEMVGTNLSTAVI